MSLPPLPLFLLLPRAATPAALARTRSVTIASRGPHHALPPPLLLRHSQSLPIAAPDTPLDTAGGSFVTRFVLLATTFVLRLLRATFEATKRLLLRCFCRVDACSTDTAKLSATRGETAAARLLPRRERGHLTRNRRRGRSSRSRELRPTATTGNLLTSPFLVFTGISVMREAEPTSTATGPTTAKVPTPSALQLHASVETVRIGLSESGVASPAPSSPSSPTHSSAASAETASSSLAHSLSDAALGKPEEPTDAVPSPLLMGKGRRITPFPALDEPSPSEDAKHTRSLTSQQDLDQRRNSFSAMTADGRAQLRRRSHDFTDYASFTMPPPGSSAGFLHARSKNHVHLRMYGKADTVPTKRLTARQEEGAALVDVLCPASRTVWRRGQPVSIEWKVLDVGVESVQIELMEEGSNATTTITRATPNNGFFMYPKVPWGMQSGPTYFLRISSAADPARYMTTVFFTIGSAP
ncbi:hypothetical protein PybrP1_004583 [[Pythium] brassicae (nom. inval.)]|nr:hypothetical protein PybrP1_004583 [[Pythium] brassicae (nom. inval.)]